MRIVHNCFKKTMIIIKKIKKCSNIIFENKVIIYYTQVLRKLTFV
jgi:hypothetical protein